MLQIHAIRAILSVSPTVEVHLEYFDPSHKALDIDDTLAVTYL